ncbi:hypothetical protein GCM10023306_28240 [Novosphingobium ginsenosidimutans]
MISFSNSIEPVDWAKAGALSAATPMAKLLAAVVRAELMRMTKGFPVSKLLKHVTSGAGRIAPAPAADANSGAAPRTKQPCVTSL